MTITLKANTNQEAFDAVMRHLHQQTERAVSAGGQCQYVTPDGNRCAVGALMDADDETILRVLYVTGDACFCGEDDCDGTCDDKDYNGEAVSDLVCAGLLSIGDLDEDLLGDLQYLHDTIGFRDEGKFLAWDRMREKAREHELSTAVLDELGV